MLIAAFHAIVEQRKRNTFAKILPEVPCLSVFGQLNAMTTEIIIIGAKVVIFSQTANVFAFQSHAK